MPGENYRITVYVFGNPGAGKAALLWQEVNAGFVTTIINTGARDSYIKTYPAGQPIQDKTFKADIRDPYNQLTDRLNIDRRGDAFLLVYDISDERTFNDIRAWKSRIEKEYVHGSANFILVGNKCDLIGERQVASTSGQALADEWGIPFFETSAKNNINVNEVFQEAIRCHYQANIEPDEKAAEAKARAAQAPSFFALVPFVLFYVNVFKSIAKLVSGLFGRSAEVAAPAPAQPNLVAAADRQPDEEAQGKVAAAERQAHAAAVRAAELQGQVWALQEQDRMRQEQDKNKRIDDAKREIFHPQAGAQAEIDKDDKKKQANSDPVNDQKNRSEKIKGALAAARKERQEKLAEYKARNPNFLNNPPEWAVDKSISLEIYTCPVSFRDRTYEKCDILDHLLRNNTDPNTGEVLELGPHLPKLVERDDIIERIAEAIGPQQQNQVGAPAADGDESEGKPLNF